MTTSGCNVCKYGMSCRGGDNVTVNYQWYGIEGKEDNSPDGTLLVSRCPLGYCCNTYDGCYFLNKSILCQTGRDPSVPLCGHCATNYTETTSSQGVCKVCTSNSGVWVLIVPAFLGSIMIGNFIRGGLGPIQTVPHPTITYITKTLMWVFQLLPYLTSQSTSVLLLPITNFLNFDINVGGTSSSGYCITKNLGPREKLFFQLMPTLSYGIQFLIIFGFFQFKLRKESTEEQAHYNEVIKGAAWQVGLILYNKVSGSLIQLSDCRSIGTEYGTRMYYAGSVVCYDAIAWVCIACLFSCLLFPLVVWRALYITKKQFGWIGLRKQWSFLIMPYRRTMYWYGAWNLLRGFVVIMVSSIPSSAPDVTATYLACTMGLILGFHVYAQPYYHQINNRLETFALFCAFGITLLNIKETAPAIFATIISLLSILPMGPVAMVMLGFVYDKLPYQFQSEIWSTQEGDTFDPSSSLLSPSVKPVLGSIFVLNLGCKRVHIVKKSLITELQENALSLAEIELKKLQESTYKEDDSRSWRNSLSFNQEMQQEIAAPDPMQNVDEGSSSSFTKSSSEGDPEEKKDELDESDIDNKDNYDYENENEESKSSYDSQYARMTSLADEQTNNIEMQVLSTTIKGNGKKNKITDRTQQNVMKSDYQKNKGANSFGSSAREHKMGLLLNEDERIIVESNIMMNVFNEVFDIFKDLTNVDQIQTNNNSDGHNSNDNNKDDEVLSSKQQNKQNTSSIIDSEIEDDIRRSPGISQPTQELVSFVSTSLNQTTGKTNNQQQSSKKKQYNNVDENSDDENKNDNNQQSLQIKTHQAQVSSFGNLDFDNILQTFDDGNNNIVDENNEDTVKNKMPTNDDAKNNKKTEKSKNLNKIDIDGNV